MKRGWGVLTLSLFSCVLLLTLRPASGGPLSERVVFVAPSNDLPKIYICRSDGRDLKRLSRAAGPQLQPSYSPASGRFYFVRPDAKRRAQIVSVDSEGEDLRVHTEGVSSARYPEPSPDGQRLIFSTDRWGSLELAQLELATGEITRLTYDQATNTWPRYSPDGTQVVYLSRAHGQSELYLLTLATGSRKRLTQTPFEEGPAAWSPDGRRLIATQLKPPRRRSYLLEIDLETQTHRTLLPEMTRIQNPVYSKDGRLVVFISNQVLWSYDPADTVAQLFPIRGQFAPEFVRWVEFPLP